MSLRTDFDHTTGRVVVVRGLLGVLVGALPAAGLICWSGPALNGDPLLLTVMQTGCVVGALIGAGSAAAGRLGAILKSRGAASSRPHVVEPLPPMPAPARITKHRVRVNGTRVSVAPEHEHSSMPEESPAEPLPMEPAVRSPEEFAARQDQPALRPADPESERPVHPANRAMEQPQRAQQQTVRPAEALLGPRPPSALPERPAAEQPADYVYTEFRHNE